MYAPLWQDDNAGLMTTYRIVPRRGTYRVEAVEPNGHARLLGLWRTEEAAVAQLKDLQAKAQREAEVGWQPR